VLFDAVVTFDELGDSRLDWVNNAGADLAGYNVYCSASSTEDFIMQTRCRLRQWLAL